MAGRFADAGSGVHTGQEFPARGQQVVAPVRRAVRRANAGIEFVQLRSAGGRVPRISVDLLNNNGLVQVNQDAPAVGAVAEKEIAARIVWLGGQIAPRQFFHSGPVDVLPPGHQREPGGPHAAGRVRSRNFLKRELRCRLGVGDAFH